MNLKVGLLGGGSWGTTVAALTARNCPTNLWARRPETVADINNNKRNERYLPGATLPSSLKAFSTIEDTVKEADVVVMGVPAQHFRQVLLEAKPHIRPWVPIISLAKGLEVGTKLSLIHI